MTNITPLPTAAATPPRNPRLHGPKPRGIVYLPAYRRDQARKQRERGNPTLAYRDKLQALTPAERAHHLIEIAQDIINRAREMLGPGCTGPERPA